MRPVSNGAMPPLEDEAWDAAAAYRPGRSSDEELAEGRRQASRSGGPILFVTEEVLGLDEGYDKWCVHFAEALADLCPVITRMTTKNREPYPAPLKLLARLVDAIHAGLGREVRRTRPRAVVYASQHPMTVPALLRAWLLRRLARAPVAMVVLQPNCTTRASRVLARWLPPDLMLLGTDEECGAARALGLRAALVRSGVDEHRFRPPAPAEKQTLRRKWAIPPDAFVVLHVGHLRKSRNLHALVPLASEPGVVPIVVASRREAPESEELRRELTASGVLVLTGYIPHVEELYRLADCYAFPVLEGAVATPLSVVEGRASGLPVVARRFRSLGEDVGRALEVEVVDSDEEFVARTLAHRSETASFGDLPDEFTWAGVARRVLLLLDTLTSRRG